MRKKTGINHYIILLSLMISLSVYSACTGKKTANAASSIKTIQSVEEFEKIISASPNRLLVFDLYADWCGPCRILSPLLAEIAQENKKKAAFYKINVDRLPQLASAFRVQGIPHVAFLKNKTIMYAITGLRSKDSYKKAINRLSEQGDEKIVSGPDGEITGGIRIITFKTGIKPHSLYVFRGETVKLIFEKQAYPFSVHIPDFKISQKAGKNEVLEISFKAKKIGVFPIFCNGNCPAGDGQLHGKIIVMQYKAGDEAKYDEITAAAAKEMIAKVNPLILDVRTPNEFYGGHIPGATLIPLQQLKQRISEIEKFKDKEILIYCRSGNRSTVAGEILIDEGFKKISNLKYGILEWLKKGYEIKKAKKETFL